PTSSASAILTLLESIAATSAFSFIGRIVVTVVGLRSDLTPQPSIGIIFLSSRLNTILFPFSSSSFGSIHLLNDSAIARSPRLRLASKGGFSWVAMLFTNNCGHKYINIVHNDLYAQQ